MKQIVVFILLSLFIMGCTNQINKPGINENSSNDYPKEYENRTYCESDSDCVFQEDDCCGEAINKYNYDPNRPTIPPCHTTCLPSEARQIYCNLNQCQIKVDCSKCEFVNMWIDKTGCDRGNILAGKACNELKSCEC